MICDRCRLETFKRCGEMLKLKYSDEKRFVCNSCISDILQSWSPMYISRLKTGKNMGLGLEGY